MADYPGGGTHRVLFDFYAQNQVPGSVEHLHFNASCRARQGQHAGVIGYPIFVGLNVGTEGMAFRCYTVNVKNDADEAFLSFLDSDAFKAGLLLASTAQPALATRHRNVPVQEFHMGLDFSSDPMGARLAEGAYLAVQIPESVQVVWDWSEWVYDPSTGHVVSRTDPSLLIP